MHKVYGLGFFVLACFSAWGLGSGHWTFAIFKALVFVAATTGAITFLIMDRPVGLGKRVFECNDHEQQQMALDLREFVTIVRKDGMIAGEGALFKIRNSFARRLVKFVLEGFDPAAVQAMVQTYKKSVTEDLEQNRKWFQDLSGRIGLAGLLGTLVTIAVQGGATGSLSPTMIVLPLMVGFVGQEFSRMWVQSESDREHRNIEEFFDLLQIGLTSLQQGHHFSLLESQMLTRLGKIPPEKFST